MICKTKDDSASQARSHAGRSLSFPIQTRKMLFRTKANRSIGGQPHNSKLVKENAWLAHNKSDIHAQQTNTIWTLCNLLKNSKFNENIHWIPIYLVPTYMPIARAVRRGNCILNVKYFQFCVRDISSILWDLRLCWKWLLANQQKRLHKKKSQPRT